ncbi:hypothetical protein [Rugamonas sp.]|uniref:hypothetical protein n=1 Tax=Rugamonas sp. TaxID=1926287 RepID=UPI0025D6F75F|nr:hypothetical protein [Rugamonas sp.]
MALHHTIQKILLTGVTRTPAPAQTEPRPPAILLPLIDAVAASHRRFNARAIDYGNRYRSAFWAIYLLSAVAVLCAVLPLALGWDDAASGMGHFSVVWVVAELLVIASVGLIYWRGHQQDWQGQWLAARTQAELAWYLPLIAPLVDFSTAATATNWYIRLLDPAHQLETGTDIDALCSAHEAGVGELLREAWLSPQFVVAYAQWAADLLEGQRQYHARIAERQHALQHRVHAINTCLFGLTALGAASHLLVHSKILTLVTTFFPALGASLHGALAQSEAYRLEAT